MTDKELILKLGGPTKVAMRLKYDLKKGGAQRVQNWMARGIPSKVKVDHPDLFMRPLTEEKGVSAPDASGSKGGTEAVGSVPPL